MNERDETVLRTGALSAARVFVRYLKEGRRFQSVRFEMSPEDEEQLIDNLVAWANARTAD
jgi:hypothetical protein